MNITILKYFSYAVIILFTLKSTLFGQIDGSTSNPYIYPYLQNVTPTSMTIMWETKDPVKGTIDYGKSEKFEQSITESGSAKIHEIKLEDLETNTTYHYRVKYNDVVLPVASFTTAPEPGARYWSLVAYGDNRSIPENHERVVKQILKTTPDIILNSGDLVAHGSVYEEWKRQYFDPMKGLAENIPIYPCLGNHEQNADHYYNYMSLPDENDEKYYSFNYGNAHIIALNSNRRDAPFEINEEQTKWLIRDLQENRDAEWKIVFFHHPLFRCSPDRGIEPQRWVWQPIFDEYGVDLVLNGHDHYYQRTYAIANYKGQPSRGVYHIISGGGGAPNYPIIPKVHAAARKSVHHFTSLDFINDRILGRAIDDEGNIFDSFVIDKKSTNSPEEFISYEIYEIERDLGDAVIQLPVIEVNNHPKIDEVISFNNPFHHPLKLSFKWESSAAWLTGNPETKIINPGEQIKIDIVAEAEGNKFYPLPSASIELHTTDGKIPFKNNSLIFHPLKLWKKKKVNAAKFETPPVTDGDLSDDCWTDAFSASDFIDLQGEVEAKRKVKVFAGTGNNHLHFAGRMEAPENVLKNCYTERDNRRVFRDDHLQVHIGVGSKVYSFIVNPVGNLYDLSSEDGKWNSSAEVAAKINPGGWQFELTIALEELNINNEELSINFVRNDKEGNTESVYISTFKKSHLDHRIPMYDNDWSDVKKFAELELN